MTKLTSNDKKAIVQDLAVVFNAAVQRIRQEQIEAGCSKPGTSTSLMRWTGSALASAVDFHMAPVLAAKYPETKFDPMAIHVSENPLASGEITAIHLVGHMERLGILEEAIPVLYRVMEETSRAHNIPFSPAYKKPAKTPSP